MADEELVAQVSVEGTDESAAKLGEYADAGAAAFEKLKAAAAKAAAGVKESTKEVDAAAQDAAKGLKAVGDTKISTAPAANLKGIEQAAQQLGTEIRKGVKDLAKFAANVAKLGAVAVGAGAGLLAFAASVAKQAGGTSDALDKQAKAQIDSNNASLQGTQAAIGYQSSQRQLLTQLQSGTIDYQTYSKEVKKLNADYREQQIVARQTAAAQDAVKAANERLQKQLADQKAYNALIDKFGGPLLTSLTSLGRSVGSLYEEFKQAFGPAIASLLDVIDGSLSKNSASIVKFFDNASAKIKSFVSQNGPAIQKAFDAIGLIVGKVFNALIDAMPVLLDLFNNKLVPAIKAVGGFLEDLTTIINKTFGTNFTVGVTAAVIAVGYLTGAFKVLTTAVRLTAFAFQVLSKTPMLAVILLLAAALIYLYTAIDWEKFGTLAGKAANLIVGKWNAVIAYFKALPARIGAFFAGMWDQIKTDATTAVTWVTDAWNGMIAWFAALPGRVGAFFVSMWEQIKAGAATAVTTVTAAWESLIAWFAALPARVFAYFVGLWTQLGTSVDALIIYIAGKWDQLVAYFAALPARVFAYFVGLWTQLGTSVDELVAYINTKWNQLVGFFAGLPATIGQFFIDLANSIKNAFNDAIETVKGFFTGLYGWAKSKLLPIIDWLKDIISKNKEAAATAPSGGDPQAHARGGPVRGRGTSTSDSIAAWLSNNEYVVRAKSVAKYGKGFMDAINSGRLSVDGVRQFAAGGLVTPFTQPRLALASSSAGSGGPTNASRIVNLTIGDQHFENLLAPEDVADRMERYAVARNSSSAGRKPSWVGGSR